MRFDRTRLVIRERDLWEIVDLGMLVLKQLFVPLLSACSLTLIPLLIVDWLLLRPLLALEQNAEYFLRHTLAMACLAILQAPLATAGGTLYLGLDVFYSRLSMRQLARQLMLLAPVLIWRLLIRRLILPAWILAAWINPSDNFSSAEIWLIILAVCGWLFRAANPYLVEVLVLEDKNRLKVSNRMRALRSFGGADSVARSITLALPTMFVALSVAATVWYGLRIILGTNQFDMLIFAFSWTLALAVMSIYLMVVSYLSFLDLRIRREGWELKLLLDAAARTAEGAA